MSAKPDLKEAPSVSQLAARSPGAGAGELHHRSQYSWQRPHSQSASSVSDLWGREPNTSLPQLSPRLGECTYCTMSRKVCDFTV